MCQIIYQIFSCKNSNLFICAFINNVLLQNNIILNFVNETFILPECHILYMIINIAIGYLYVYFLICA